MKITASSIKKIYLMLSIIMVVILATAVTAIIGWDKLNKTRNNSMLDAEQYLAKNEMVFELWNDAMARHAALQAIIIEDDPFIRDELFVQHMALGGHFIKVRRQLMAMELNSTEKAFLAALRKATSSGAPVQDRVRELAMDGALEEARSLIRKPGYINDRVTIFRVFDQLLRYYRETTHSALYEAYYTVPKDTRTIIKLTSIVLILSAAIGFFMTRIVVASEAELRTEVARRTATQKELELHHQNLEARIQQEIEKYKRAEAERNQSQEKVIAIGKILEDSLNEIYIFDAESLMFIQVNKGARTNLGYSMEELKSFTPLDIKPDLTAADFKSLITPLLDGTQDKIHFTTIHKRKDGSTYPAEVNLQLSMLGESRVFVAIIMDVSEQQRVNEQLQRKNSEIDQARNELIYQQKAVDKHAIVCIADKNECLTAVNDKFVEISGFTQEELIGGHLCIGIADEHPEDFFVDLSATIQSGEIWSGEICSHNKVGECYWTMATVTPFLDESGEIYKFVVVSTDITTQKMAKEELHLKNVEIEQANKDLELSHSQTLQSEKLASVGQLAAGIAHEINTPIQFVGDNTRFLQEAFEDLMGLVEVYEALGKTANAGAVSAELAAKASTLSAEVEVDYLAEEIPKAISQSLEGVDRVSKIVRSMKDFSHPGADKKEIIDINQAIESTATVSRNEWKYHAELVTHFDEALTAVPCYPGEFNQVILNMLVNASHAIADGRTGDADELGTITISTCLADGYAEVRISDTGAGMTEEVSKRIFEPFFTTKGVGKGSGQGLAIAYAVIAEKHKGTIEVDSEPGKGTTFIIRLPMRDSTTETDIDKDPSDEEAYSICG